MKKFALTTGVLFSLPLITLAQRDGLTVEGIFDFLRDIINLAVPLVIAAAVLVFLFGVLQFIVNSGDQEKRDQGKQFMLWGIIGIFVMVSVWGLVNILVDTFDLETTAPQDSIEDLVDVPKGDLDVRP